MDIEDELKKAYLAGFVAGGISKILTSYKLDLYEKASEYAKEKVKNLGLFSVVQQRELLLDFADYSESDKTSTTTDECVDNYLDSKQ